MTTYTVSKQVQRLSWDGGAVLIEPISQDGRASWRVGPGVGVVVGLSRTGNNGQYAYQSHGIKFTSGLFSVCEYGTSKTSYAGFSVDDTFAVRVSRGVVYYEVMRDGETEFSTVYVSDTPAPSLPCVLDCAMYAPGDSVHDADFVTLAELAEEDPSLSGVEAENWWTVAGYGAEMAAGSAIASNRWSITQYGVFTSEVAPDSLENSLPPFVGYGVDANVGAFAVNRLPFFTNTFSFSENPEYVSIDNYWWIIDDIVPGPDDSNVEITNSLRPFLAFGTQVENMTFCRNFTQPFDGFGYEDTPNSVRFRLTLPPLSGYAPVLGANGTLGWAQFPSFSHSGWGRLHGGPSSGFVEFPTLFVSGTGAGSGTAEFPTLFVSGDGVGVPYGEGTALFPALYVSGSGVGGSIGVGVAWFSPLALSGSGYGPSSGIAEFPTLSLSGDGVSGSIGIGTAWFPVLSVAGEGVGGSAGDGVAWFPALSLSGYGGVGGTVLFPAFWMTGEGAGPSAAYTGPMVFSVNVTTGAMTALPVLAGVVGLYHAHGILYGRTAAGALLAFDVPAATATPVNATIRTAADSFGSIMQKRFEKLYVATRGEDGFSVGVLVDETEMWNYVTPADPVSGLTAHKVDVGRGPTFTTASLQLVNANGESAVVGGIYPVVNTLSRRPK